MKPQPLKSAIAVALAVLINVAPAYAYSYAEQEDPMAALFKSAVVAATEGRWDEVSKLAGEGIKMQKGHLFEAGRLDSRFKSFIAGKDLSKTAETFANLVYLAICEKLHRNKKENLRDYKNAKARLRLARKSYMDVLDGNVKKQDAKRSAEILAQFGTALDSIGNPGLFGIGKKEPDPDEYEKSVKAIKSLIVESFPEFAG